MIPIPNEILLSKVSYFKVANFKSFTKWNEKQDEAALLALNVCVLNCVLR